MRKLLNLFIRVAVIDRVLGLGFTIPRIDDFSSASVRRIILWFTSASVKIELPFLGLGLGDFTEDYLQTFTMEH